MALSFGGGGWIPINPDSGGPLVQTLKGIKGIRNGYFYLENGPQPAKFLVVLNFGREEAARRIAMFLATLKPMFLVQLGRAPKTAGLASVLKKVHIGYEKKRLVLSLPVDLEVVRAFLSLFEKPSRKENPSGARQP